MLFSKKASMKRLFTVTPQAFNLTQLMLYCLPTEPCVCWNYRGLLWFSCIFCFYQGASLSPRDWFLSLFHSSAGTCTSNPEVVSLIVAGIKNISLIPGMFTIETNLPCWNLVHKHKTIKFDVVEEQPSTKFIQITSIFCAYCRYGAAEADCTQALSLDGSYTKAYLRRGAARFQMGRVQQAEADYREALKLEPSNKQAQAELKSIKKVSSYLAPKVHKQLKHYGAVIPCKRQSSGL